jgi:hypothetical protein
MTDVNEDIPREVWEEVAENIFIDISNLDFSQGGSRMPDLEQKLLAALRALNKFVPQSVQVAMTQFCQTGSSAASVVAALDPNGPVAKWHEVGVTDPLESAAWETFDLSPQQVAEWRAVGLNLHDYHLWGERFSPANAAVYKAHGLTPNDWPCNSKYSIQQCDAKAVLAVASFPAVKNDFNAFWGALEWYSAVGDLLTAKTHGTAMALKNIMSPEEAAAWDMPLPDVLGWVTKGYNSEAARAMLGDGYTIDSAPHAWLDENSVGYGPIGKIVKAARDKKWRITTSRQPKSQWDLPWVRITDPNGYGYKVHCTPQGEVDCVQVFDGNVFLGLLDVSKDPMGIFSGRPWGHTVKEPVNAGVLRALDGAGWNLRLESHKDWTNFNNNKHRNANMVRVTGSGKRFYLIVSAEAKSVMIFDDKSTGGRNFADAAAATKFVKETYG